MTNNPEAPKITRHAATDPEKCREMENKYGWKLLGWDDLNSNVFEVECIFQGEAKFPRSRMDYAITEEEETE